MYITMPSFIIITHNPCIYGIEKNKFKNMHQREIYNFITLQVSHYEFTKPTCILYELSFWSQFLKNKQHRVSDAITNSYPQ